MPPRGGTAENGDQVSPAMTPFVTGPVTNKVLPPVRVVPGKGLIPEPAVDPNEFPLPFAVSGIKPKLGTEPPATQTPSTNTGKTRGSANSEQTVGGRAAAAPSLPARKKSEALHSTNKSPEGDAKSSASDETDPDETDPAKKKPRKPVTLDPALLQRALQQRNQGR